MIIEVKNLTKKFQKTTAVDNISFSIAEGEIVGLLGPNGAGKTTTIQMILGLITPTWGTINIFDRDLKFFKEEVLSQMNFSSSYTHLPYKLSVWENLYVVALLYSVPKPKERTEEVIKIMHLESVRYKTISELSSGWITRINLARTFLNKPRLMLLDEPTASLDPESAKEVRLKILEFKKRNNAAILWTSHNMAEVEELCDRVVFLRDGKIVAIDTPLGLAKKIPFCRISLMIENGEDKLLQIIRLNRWNLTKTEKFISVELTEEKIPYFINLLVEKDIKYTEISIDRPTLEDFFISIAKAKS